MIQKIVNWLENSIWTTVLIILSLWGLFDDWE